MGNLQGDITEIIEPDFGFVGAEYYYDAYGNYVVKDPESSWYSGDIHAKYVDDAVPFTYRGYLDINIGDYHLYYLGSRFYSPQLGRFLNADIYVDTGTGFLATNMFAYCNNNPVMFVDPKGEAMDDTFKLLNTIISFMKSFFSKLFPNKNIVSESNPLVLSKGIPAIVNAKSYWFKCSVRGATEVIINSLTSVTVSIYKRVNLFKKELIGTYEGNSIVKKIRESLNNTYFVNVESNVETSISCQINQYVDCKSDINGAMWVAKETSPTPDDNILYFKKWYVNKDNVSVLYEYVGNSDFLDYQTKLIDGTIEASIVALSIYLPIPNKISTAISIVSVATTFFSSPFDVKDSILNDIEDCSGYNPSDGSHVYGVVLTECMADGIMYYFVERWEGPEMYGKEGYCGIWISNG